MDDKTTTNDRSAESNMVDPVTGVASNGASETKDPGGISKGYTDPNAARTPSSAAAPEPEVHILEERVTQVAEKTTLTPEASTLTKPEVSAVSTKPPLISAAAPARPAPTPAPTIEALRSQSKPPMKQQIPIVPKENLAGAAVSNDIAKILESVKLPERRPRDQAGASAPSVSAGVANTPATPSQKSAGADQVPPMTTPKKAESDTGSIAAVHTLKHDLQNVVRDNKMSLVKAASLEEDRRAHKEAPPGETPATKQRTRRTVGIIFGALILIGLGVAALLGVSFVMNQQQNPPQVDTGSSILFAEQSIPFSLGAKSPNDLKRTLEAARTVSQRTLGSIIRIVPVVATTLEDGTVQTRAATFQEFMLSIGARPPDDLVRALSNDFFLGVHAVDENAPLIIVPVSSYDHAFSAMLRWEDGLNADLAPFFTAVPLLGTDTNGLPIKRTYKDLVMRNYDTRVLKDDAGVVQLYYSFPTPNILVIAESPYSFPEILSRLQAGRRL
ncbi:hypothetical protein HY971_02845 [Candidatus Kaiserbacteria bacterium]|nr:hypothetical protein [Candidatus Kaiserbacteria bacterium]